LTKVKEAYYNLKGDKVIWFIILLLGLFSILAVYSATGMAAFKTRGGDTEYYLFRQAIFVFAGFGLTYMCSRLHYMKYSNLAPLLLVITVPLLIYTICFGTAVNDASRWITIPFFNATFQTSDFAKLVLIVFVARSLAIKQEFIKDFNSAFLPIIIPITIICGLIAPDDLSTAGLLFLTCLLMMFIGRVSLKYVGMLIIVGVVLFSFLIVLGNFFPEAVRLETWVSRINEWLYDVDGGFHIEQSKIAIASGEYFGVGPGNSFQRNYLPNPFSDSIYAIICEEYGLLGGLFVMFLYLWLLIRCMRIVTRSPKTFGSILAIGLCLNIVIQAFANIAVSVNLVPATGLTLPLVSMGGTSILFTCITFGIILSVSKFVENPSMHQLELEEIAEDESNH